MFWLKETSTTRGPRPCVPEGKDWAYGNWMYGAVGSLDETTLTTPLTTSLDPPTPTPETELSADAGPPLTSTSPSAAPPAVKACLIDPTRTVPSVGRSAQDPTRSADRPCRLTAPHKDTGSLRPIWPDSGIGPR